MIRTYDIHREGQTPGPVKNIKALCQRHVDARKGLGWIVGPPRRESSICDDCTAGPSVLDKVIEAADAEALAAEPKPVPVLPGQRKLF